jgi:hypothetical protein
MKISNLQILNPQFVPALDKLLKKEMPLSTCEELAKAILDIEQKAVLLQKVRTAMVDKYLEKDPNGKPVIIDGNKPKYKSDEAQKQFMGELNELIRGDFEVTLTKKIDLSEEDIMPAQEYILIRDFVNLIKKPVGGAVNAEKK